MFCSRKRVVVKMLCEETFCGRKHIVEEILAKEKFYVENILWPETFSCGNVLSENFCGETFREGNLLRGKLLRIFYVTQVKLATHLST